MDCYNLCLAWNWEHDADFVGLLDHACRLRGLSLLQVTPGNLGEMLPAFDRNQFSFQVFFDRASDEDARFIAIDQWARDHGILRVNPRERAVRAWNKVVMHYALIDAGLVTPYTIVLPPYEKEPQLAPLDLSPLGESFVIKPAHGGSGDGVIREASSRSRIAIARQEFPADEYLLQSLIVPARLEGRPAWFRVIYCNGAIYPCWWDPDAPVYIPVTADEENRHHLGMLHRIVTSIAHICGLALFSTEIGRADDGRFIVVDYVNDQIDLRLQSRTHDGVPDGIAGDIAQRITALAESSAR
jgi:hypothetical protein